MNARKQGSRYTAQGILWDESVVGSPAHDLMVVAAQPMGASVQPLLPLVASHTPVVVLGRQALPSRLVRMVAGVGRAAGAPTRRQPVHVTVRLWRPSDAERLASSRDALAAGQCVITVARRATTGDVRGGKRATRSSSPSSSSAELGTPVEGLYRAEGTDQRSPNDGRRRRRRDGRQSTASSSSRSNLAVAVIAAPGASNQAALASWPSIHGAAAEDSRSQPAAGAALPVSAPGSRADESLYRELQALQAERRASDFHIDALPFVISRARPLHVGAHIQGLEQAAQAVSSGQLSQPWVESPSPTGTDAGQAVASARGWRKAQEWTVLLSGQTSPPHCSGAPPRTRWSAPVTRWSSRGRGRATRGAIRGCGSWPSPVP